MKNLYYSKVQRMLFWIAGYMNSSENVKEKIGVLTNGVNEFVAATGVEKDSVCSFVVDGCSSHYARMRVFCAKTDIVPDIAFKISEKYTMAEWIER